MSEFLRCDATGCDHVEDVGAITAEMVDKPCPKCGANLLTKADFDVYAAVFQPAMRMMFDLGLAKEAASGTPPEQSITVNYHDGEMRVKMPKARTA